MSTAGGIPTGGNLPGQDEITYRAGTYASFRADMVHALSGRQELSGITTRDSDDPVMAVVEAWSVVLDVLTFYQERVANEGFIRTATERRSVLELARAIGYELGPGVAATTWLSFEVVAAPGGIDTFVMPTGTSAQSVPGPGELPQVFETVTEVRARPEWNSVPVLCEEPARPEPGDPVVRLKGTDLGLRIGDPLLVLQPAIPGAQGTSAWFDVRRVRDTEVVQAVSASPTDPEPLIGAHTQVTLDSALVANTATPDPTSGLASTTILVLRQRAALFGFNAQPWEALPVALRVGEIDPGSLTLPGAAVEMLQAEERDRAPIGKGKARKAASSGSSGVLTGAYKNRRDSWADAVLGTAATSVDLDQVYPGVVAGSWAVFERSGAMAVRALAKVTEHPRSDFGLAGRVSRLTFGFGDLAGFSPRTTNVLAQSEGLDLAGTPLPASLGGVDWLDLARVIPALDVGRTVVITGADDKGDAVSETATVKSVTMSAAGKPRVTFEGNLTNTYLRSSVRLLGNVAMATHGESRAEVLGSGDQRVPFQSFTLMQKPLTHVTASTSTGTRTTLAVWVGGVRWTEVRSLYGQSADARVYVTRRADDGTVTIQFGDGVHGARLPSGQDQVVATYRVGLGRAALVGTGRVSIPLARPLGLVNVENPVPATGADDPEKLGAARDNAPITVRTLGRVVSVLDYEDLAAAFAGIGKARADVLWDGERAAIHVTVTGPVGEAVAATSAVYADLLAAIDDVRHATIPVVVNSYQDKRFAVDARLVIASERRPADVIARAISALTSNYGFARRGLAVPVTASELLTTLQEVPGVVAVLLTAFHEVGAEATREDVISAFPARRIQGQTLAADLVTIDSAAIHLIEADSDQGVGA